VSRAPKASKEEAAEPAKAAPEPAAAPAPTEKPAKGPKPPKEGKAKVAKAAAPGEGSKKKQKIIPDNPDFRYIVRVAGTDLDGTRSAGLALTGVRGVGRRIAEVACRISSVNPREMIGNLPEATVEGLEALLTELPQKSPVWMINHPRDPVTGVSMYVFGGDIETARRDDVNRMKMIRSYRGVRHERGQKVRGQRTRSNGRTGMAAGVIKKAAKEAAQAAAKEAAGPRTPPPPAAAEKKE
jgi:small subunit ribosomal protein S13